MEQAEVPSRRDPPRSGARRPRRRGARMPAGPPGAPRCVRHRRGRARAADLVIQAAPSGRRARSGGRDRREGRTAPRWTSGAGLRADPHGGRRRPADVILSVTAHHAAGDRRSTRGARRWASHQRRPPRPLLEAGARWRVKADRCRT
ncbi:hypothetical protein QJS66_14625 [Kocuria rhizophila]|nr:hypothetical protein QJS66_14625 [Kocuria rhizophila]